MPLGAVGLGILTGLGAAAGGAAAQGAGSFIASRSPEGRALREEGKKAASRLAKDDYRDHGRVLAAQKQLRSSVEGATKEAETAALQGMRAGGFGRGGAQQEAVGRLAETKAGAIAAGTGEIERAEAAREQAERAADLAFVAGRRDQRAGELTQAIGAGVELGTAVGTKAGMARHEAETGGYDLGEKGASSVAGQQKRRQAGGTAATGLTDDVVL